MDQYYQHEEDVETPEMELDNIRAQDGARKAVTIWSQETLANARTQAEVIWNQAAERGDVETQNGVVEIFKAAEHMQQNLAFTNDALGSVLEAAKALTEQKKEIESQLEDITEAVYNVDTNHPMLSSFAEIISQDAFEYAAEGAFEDAYTEASEVAYDNIFDNVKRTIREFSPNTPYVAMNIFFQALQGDVPMNDIQRGLLLSLLQTFNVEIKAS